jgi:pimeloyl-ACP methyl ester carboxylesterase
VIRPWLLLGVALLGAGPARADSRIERLRVPGFRDAALIAPRAAGKRRVVIGLHGNFDRPEWFCGEGLAPLVDGQAWLLCPRGVPRADAPREWDRWTFPARARVRAEVDAALAALARAHPDRVAPGPPLLAGFSLGAILAARFAVASPDRFPRLYLVEGSHQVWDPPAVARFARGGGRAIVFGCGGRGCGAVTRRLCAGFARAKVDCATATAPRLGHGYGAPLPELVRPSWRSLFAEGRGPAAGP